MRHRRVVLACALASIASGCGGADEATNPPLHPAATRDAPDAALVEPTVTRAAAPQGWPAASEAKPSSAAPQPHVARRPQRPRAPSKGKCVTPTAIAGGDPQPDLKLRATGPTSMRLGEFPTIEASIENVSRRGHAIVLPGDGSEVGWRDPVITFTAFIDDGDGCWRPLPRAQISRCGVFDRVWQDEIVRVAAGKTQALGALWADPFFEWRKGTVRLFLHYAWTAGAANKGNVTTSVDLAGMAKEAPYEIVSDPIEIVVRE